LIKTFFSPAPHCQRLPADQIDKTYRRFRYQVFEASFLGYVMSYLCRNNLGTVAKEMSDTLKYDHGMLGSILAVTAISYGLAKFLMGSLSDRSNPRKFMAAALFLTACLNFGFGASTNYYVHLLLWMFNGLAQGMAGPPCARIICHWFSSHERGTISSRWNINHNVGGGLAGIIAAAAATHFGWRSAFFVPGIICLLGSIYLLWRLRDTPQSVGLPPIEEYKNDYTKEELERRGDTHEAELSTRELFVTYIFKNKLLWLFAAANFFVYVIRYSMLDWAPLYLSEAKGAKLTDGGWAILMLEFGGIPSTLLLGWLSDKIGGRRGLISFLCMFPILFAFMVIIWNPPGHLNIDMAALVTIGFFIYPALALVGITGMDMSSKKAAGTACGVIGLWGYIGRTTQAYVFGGMMDYFSKTHGLAQAWNFVLWAIVGCTFVGIILLFFTRKIRPRA